MQVDAVTFYAAIRWWWLWVPRNGAVILQKHHLGLNAMSLSVLFATTWIACVRCVGARAPENLLWGRTCGETIINLIAYLTCLSLVMSLFWSLRVSWCVYILQVWLQLQGLMYLSDLVSTYTTEYIWSVDEGVCSIICTLGGLLSLLRLLWWHVNLIIVVRDTTGVRSSTIFSTLYYVHVDVTTLGKGPCSREIFTVSRMVHILDISFPVRIDHHGPGLRDTVMLISCCVIRLSHWIGTRHWLATIQTLVTWRSHYFVYSIELDLVLLIERMEVETYLAIVGRLVIMGDNCWLVYEAVHSGCVRLTRDLAGRESRSLRYLTCCCTGISGSRFRADVSCFRLKSDLGIYLFRRRHLSTDLRALSLFCIRRLVDVCSTPRSLLLAPRWSPPRISIISCLRSRFRVLGLNKQIVLTTIDSLVITWRSCCWLFLALL